MRWQGRVGRSKMRGICYAVVNLALRSDRVPRSLGWVSCRSASGLPPPGAALHLFRLKVIVACESDDVFVELPMEVAVDRNRMLLIGSAVVPVLVIAYMMFGLGGTSVPR
jgi:hypothetical protein